MAIIMIYGRGSMNGHDWKEINLRYSIIDILLEKKNMKMYQVRDTITNDICVMKIRMGRKLTDIYLQLEEIHHPNLPEIYDVIYDGYDTIIIEEYIAGEGLDKQIERQVLKEGETINIILQLCDALSVIHTLNPIIIHRDIKASNIIVRADGIVKLIDFDAARNFHEEQERDTQQMGTLEYASPEHFGYAQTDQKSDIYSVGVLMHEMLTGETFSQENIHYKGKLKKIIQKCTRVNANWRYHTALQLKKELEDFCHRRKRCVVAVVVLIMLVFGVAVGGIMYHKQQKKKQVVLEEQKIPIDQQKKAAFNKRFVAFDKENGNMANLVRDEYVVEELDQLLGNDCSYFLNNFEEISGYYDEDEEAYIISGSRIASDFSKRKYCSILTIRRNGIIQCAYTTYDLFDWLICFETNAEEEYHKIPLGVQLWYIKRYRNGFQQLLLEEDLQGLLLDVDVENGEIVLSGDYVLRSATGCTGKIHISEAKKYKDGDRDYRIKGFVRYGKEEQKINILMSCWNYRCYYYEGEDRQTDMVAFYDSVFIDDYLNNGSDDITFTGQFIKERGDS